MKTSAAASAVQKTVTTPSPVPEDAAAAIAKKFELVFQQAFPLAAPAAASPGRWRLFITLAHHEAPTLNWAAAAHWATRGMPASALNPWFAATGLEKKKDLFVALQLSASTLSRAKPGTTLDPAITERMLRQSELFLRAAEVFGGDGAVWMAKPHDLLGGKAPVEYAANEFGGAKVRQMLNAIEYGGVV